MKKELITGEGVKRRHKTAVHELNTKKKHLKLRVHCTSLMEKLEEKTQELVQKQQKLDQTKQEPLDWDTASGGVCMRSMICRVISSGLAIASHRLHTAQGSRDCHSCIGLHSQTRRCSTSTDRQTRTHKLCLYSGLHLPI